MTTAWEELLVEDFEGPPPPDVSTAIYPKKVKPSKIISPYDLPRLHTRVLLKYLHSARIDGYYDPDYAHRSYVGPGHRPPISLDEIKAELAKRPHLPSKREGRTLRRARAKAR